MSVVALDVKCTYFLHQGVLSQTRLDTSAYYPPVLRESVLFIGTQFSILYTRLDTSAYYPPVLPSVAHLMSWSIKVSLMATECCSIVCAGGQSEKGDTMCPRASGKHVQAGNTF
jgi:hypothetical protein